MKVKIEKCHDRAKTPERKSASAAGSDLSVAETAEIRPGEAVMLRTGVKVAIPDGYVGLVFERSSFNKNTGCSLTNKVGVIDSDYRGEIFLSVRNGTRHALVVGEGERVAQLVVIPYLPAEFEEVKALDATARGQGGFGSTGK